MNREDDRHVGYHCFGDLYDSHRLIQDSIKEGGEEQLEKALDRCESDIRIFGPRYSLSYGRALYLVSRVMTARMLDQYAEVEPPRT